MNMNKIKFTLKPYKGIGSTVYRHGTIIKLVDGWPTVVGHFDDATGIKYNGTFQIVEVK